MVTEKPCSDNGESLEGVFGLCLDLEASSDDSNPRDFDGDVQFIHNRLKSMVFKSPDKLREQAKRILGERSKVGNSVAMGDQAPMVNKEILPVVAEVGRRERRPGLGLGREQAQFSLNPTSSQLGLGSEPTFNINDPKNTESVLKAYEQYDGSKSKWHGLKGDVLPDSKMVNSVAMGEQDPMVNKEVLPVVADVSLRERRPGLGLGRKRARFSLNPTSSQLGVGSEPPTLNINEFKDPEAFFKACEQYDVAKREWHRLKGDVLPDSNQQNTTVNKRTRRPGMGLSNRSIKYKHLYPPDDNRFCNDAPSSQDSFPSSILNPYRHDPRESDQDITSPGASLAGSISEGEHGIDPILEELLSYNCDELDEDRAMNILEERLKIKPIVHEKLNLPDFRDIPKIDFDINLPKRRQTSSFADLLNGTGRGRITSMKHRKGLESSERLVTSPTPSKSPFSPLSLLINKRILRSRSSKDPFSADEIDSEVATSPSNRISKELSDTDDPVEVSKTQKGKFEEGLNAEKSASHLLSSSRDPVSLDDVDDSSQRSSKQLSDIRRQSNRESLLLKKNGAIEVSETSKRKSDECLNVGESAFHLSSSSKDPLSATSPSKRSKKEFSEIDSPFENNDPIEVSETHKSKLDEGHVGKSASRLSSSSKDPVSASEIGGKVAVNLSLLFEKEKSTEVSETHISKLDEGLNVGKSASRLSSSSKDPVPASDIGGELSVNLSLLFEKENAYEVSETDKSKLEGLNVGEIASHLSGIHDASMENVGMRDEIALNDADETAKENENIIRDEVEDTVDPSLDDDSVEHIEIAKEKPKAASKRRKVGRRKSLAGGYDADETAKENENIIQDEVEDTVDPSLDDDSIDHTEIAKEKRKAASKRHKVDRRKSLAGAGTKWESGVRRSTRFKCRPLEYWNGERLLYGRIHKSLPTVIGWKYASPSAKDKGLKVTSFVGVEHKALLDMVARY